MRKKMFKEHEEENLAQPTPLDIIQNEAAGVYEEFIATDGYRKDEPNNIGSVEPLNIEIWRD
jgi:hypothetical protein